MKKVHSEIDRGQLAKRSAYQLGLAGLIPFWALPIAQLLGAAIDPNILASVEHWVLIYGITIVSFMSGGRWAFRLQDPAIHGSAVFGGLLGAVMPPLLGWIIVGLPEETIGSPYSKLALLALLLGFILYQDYSHRSALPPWYFDLRVILTVGASSAIVLALILSAA